MSFRNYNELQSDHGFISFVYVNKELNKHLCLKINIASSLLLGRLPRYRFQT